MSDQAKAPPGASNPAAASSNGPTIDPTATALAWEETFERPLTACYWDPLNRFIAVGSEEYGIVRCVVADRQKAALVGPHDSWVRAIGVSPDGELLITGGYDGRLVWWSAADAGGTPLRSIDAHQGWIRALAIAPGGKLLATCGNDRCVRLWDLASGELLQTFTGHQSHVYHVSFSPTDDTLASCDLKSITKVWPTATAARASQPEGDRAASEAPAATPPAESNKCLRELPALEALSKYDTSFRADIGGARCMVHARDGKRLAVGGITNVTNAFAGIGEVAVALVDYQSGQVESLWVSKEKLRGTAWGIAEHPQGFWIGLAGGGAGGWLYFWKPDSAEEFYKLKLKSDARGMSLSPDGRQVAVAHADRTLRVYNLHAT